MDLWDQQCWSGQPGSGLAVLRSKNKLDIVRLYFNCSSSYLPFLTERHHWLLPFYTSFGDPDLSWGSQVQWKAKSVGFTFFHIVSVNRSGWNLMCWNDHSWASWSFLCVRFIESCKISAVLLTGSKNFGTDMSSVIYEPIWFILYVMLDTTELYVLILI